jgi:hypothetical protein
MVRYFYPGIDVGELTLYQLGELMKDLCEIKKMESGDDQKDSDRMTAADKIAMYESEN